MTSWPILERELRVWARRGATYWGRFAVAAGGVFVCASPLLWSDAFITQGATGRHIFDGVVSVAFLLCCMACLLTADAISRERREGTLGLLLMTRVKHLDLLLGKLTSNGVASLVGLVALMPVLALPLLTGGVSGSEAMRWALALLDTMFLALCVGLGASAWGLERFRTAWSSLLILAGLILVPYLLGLSMPETHLKLASPLGAISQAPDLRYKISRGGYWFSLILVQTLAWVFLIAAMIRLGRRTYEKDEPSSVSSAPAVSSGAGLEASPGEPASSTPAVPSPIPCPYCGRQNVADALFCGECGTELRPRLVQRPGAWTLSSAPTPLHWLLARQRGLKPLLWIAAFIGCCDFMAFQVLSRFLGVGIGSSFLGVYPVYGLAESTIEAALFAWVASRFLVDARRTGELELLLTTPLGAQKLISTQWETLKRLARWPILVMVGLPIVLQLFLSIAGPSSSFFIWKFYSILSVPLHVANTILAVSAVFWLAPWFALQLQGQARVIFWTVLLVRGLPYLAGSAWSLAYRSFLNWGVQTKPWPNSFWFLGFLVPPVAILVFYLWLIQVARGRLLHLSGAEPIQASHVLSGAWSQFANFVRRARSWRAT